MKKFALAAALLAAPVASNAAVFDSTSWSSCIGAATCSLGGASFSAGAGAVFAESAHGGVKGLGVSTAGDGGGARGKEIQGLRGGSEAMTVAFSGPRYGGFDIGLAHLYNTAQISADPNEEAVITALLVGGGSTSFVVRSIASSPTGFQTVGAAPHSGVKATPTGAGTFEIGRLFAGLGVTGLVFSAGVTPKGKGLESSDYTVSSIAPVPLPAAAWLLIGGLGAMGLVARKRRGA